MKKIIFVALIAFAINTKAQITLQFTLDSVAINNQFYCTDLGNNDFKYVLVDTFINGFHLYNMNMTPYLTVNIPTTYGKIASGYLPIYITKTLFDCDSTNIEYVYEDQLNALKTPFYVFRTDGTQLLKVDSANGPYCFGSYGGSHDVRPIQKTSDGAKLFLQYHNQQYNSGIKIYALCGTLPTTNVYDFSTQKSYMKVYPNPTNMEINFQITPPNNQEEFQLVIIDGNAKEQRREKITSASNKYSLDVSNLESGVYYYTLCTKSKVYQTGKFILTK